MPALVSIETTIPSVIERLDRMSEVAIAETRALLERSAIAVREAYLPALRNDTPRRTGELADSSVADIALDADGAAITFRQTKTVPWRGGYPLARFLIDGTAPHVIEAVNAGALYWPGAEHPVKRVDHPGFPGRDYPGQAMDESMPAIHAALASESDAVARSVVRGLVA